MKLVQIDYYDRFYDETIFTLHISDLPQVIQDKAREIDGENYDPACFGMSVWYELESGEFHVLTEMDSTRKFCNVFYVDDSGHQNWFQAKLSRDFMKEVFSACAKVIAEYEKELKPSIRNILRKAEKAAKAKPMQNREQKAEKGAR